MKMSKWIFVLLVTSFCAGCSAGSGTVKFGSYPADSGIAYFNLLGYSQAPTVRNLFGPDAAFVTSFNGRPSTVTLESGSGNRDAFTGVLLLSTEREPGKMVDGLRMRVTFEHDTASGMSHVRYVKIENLLSGQVSEQTSSGTQMEDGRVFGLFAGMVEYFWEY